MQGLKPDADWIGFIGPTKVVPLLQNLRSGRIGEFFRSLLAPREGRSNDLNLCRALTMDSIIETPL